LIILIQATGTNYYLGGYDKKPLWVYGRKRALHYYSRVKARMTVVRLQDEGFNNFDNVELVRVK